LLITTLFLFSAFVEAIYNKHFAVDEKTSPEAESGGEGGEGGVNMHYYRALTKHDFYTYFFLFMKRSL
jgi:hypothetical protein